MNKNKIFRISGLTFMIAGLFASPTWADVQIEEKKDLGTLKRDNLGSSYIYALSDDGNIAGGRFDNDNGNNRAIIWSGDNYQTKTDLGTLRNDNLGYSEVNSLSADGRIAGGTALNDDGNSRATIWSGDNYQTKTDLGTLRNDNSGKSWLNTLSADGRIAGGHAEENKGNSRAIIWSGNNYQTKTDLRTLKSDNTGYSWVYALSADGRIAGGKANNDNGNLHAIIWSGDNYQTKTDLGTLKRDNSGYSEVSALSADGRIAGGRADNDNGNDHAIIWSGDNYQTKTDLGTLKSDNTGHSWVHALSADGRIAGGRADNDNGNLHAIIWSGDNYQTKTDLGTLKSDNSGFSSVYALSANGRIAGGVAIDDRGSRRPTLWRLDYRAPTNPPVTQPTQPTTPVTQPTQPTTPTVTPPTTQPTAPVTQPTPPTPPTTPTVTQPTQPTTPTVTPPTTQPTAPVTQPTPPTPPTTPTQPTTPVTQPTQPSTPTVTPPTTATPVNPQPTPVVAPVVVAKIDVDNSRQSIQQLGRDTVNMLAQQRDSLQHLHDSCHHGQGSWCYRLEQRFAKNQGNKENSLGLSLGYGISPNLTLGVNYQHGFSRDLPNSFQENGNQQGMGVFARYQQNGWFVEPSLAWNRYRGEIQRPMLSNTESAKHKTRVQGKSVRLTVGQLWQDDDHQQAFSWYTALRHDDVRRPAYQENVEGFPVSYGQARFKETTTAVGMQFQQPLTEQLSWQTRAEVEQRLRGDEPTYTAQADYIGNFQERIKVNRTRASLQTGLRYAFGPSMNVEVAPYVKRGAVGNKTDWGTVLRLQGQF